jgi:hypothetical protein
MPHAAINNVDLYYEIHGKGIHAWTLSMNGGGQDNDNKGLFYYAWAVQSGDVAVLATPVPAAVWLFGSGLLGLIGMARRKKAT